MDAIITTLAFAFLTLFASPAEAGSPFELGSIRSANPMSDANEWETEGIIRRIEKERSMITITHEEIPGYMRKMTMPFWIEDPKLFEGLEVDDEVSFRFRRGDKGKHFIIRISKKPKRSSK